VLGMRAWSVACSFGLLTAVACSKNESNPITTTSTGATGGTTSAGATGGTGGGGGLGGAGGGYTGCHPLTNDADPVEIMLVAQDLPAPGGGLIRNGTYFLTAMNRYTGASGGSGPTGAMWQETVQYNGPEVWMIYNQFDAAGEQKLTLHFQPDDNGGIAYSATCPQSLSVPYDHYTFTDPDTMKLYSTQASVEWVYTLQDNGSGTN
jgi:hypothetical protein